MIAHLLDHAVSVWRPTQVVTGKLRQVDQSWDCIIHAQENNAAVQHRGGVIQQRRPGEFVDGETMVYMGDCEVTDGDVVRVEDGPNAPGLLRVERAYRPFRGAPLHLRCEQWAGEDPSGYSTEAAS